MHIYWTGVAADVLRSGDTSCRWVLEESVRGEVFAAGHAEAGNDFPLYAFDDAAERADGGYRLYGHKIFGSLTPVWTRLGLHAMDTADPAEPKIVHAFLPRDATGSDLRPGTCHGHARHAVDDTILEGAFVPDRYIPARRACGRRAPIVRPQHLRLGGADLRQHLPRHSPAGDRSRRRQPKKRRRLPWVGVRWPTTQMLQHSVAEMTLILDGMIGHVDQVAEDWSERRGSWRPLAGEAGVGEVPLPSKARRRSSIWPWRFRAAPACSRATSWSGCTATCAAAASTRQTPALAHEIVGKTTLGILGEEPRW